MFATFRNTAFSLGAAALALAAPLASPAQAAYVVSLQQVGANVVATGSGTIDRTDLSFYSVGQYQPLIEPSNDEIIVGQQSRAGPTAVSVFSTISGPTSFGSGSFLLANSGSGDEVGVGSFTRAGISTDIVIVPNLYVSGSPLSDSATWDNLTFSGLGVTPGTYEWTWGSGVHADSFTLQIGPVAAVPEPGSLPVLVMGLAGLGLVMRTRRA